jgi:hypothetical protein
MIKGRIRITNPNTGKLLHEQDMHSFTKEFLLRLNTALHGEWGQYLFRNAEVVVGSSDVAEDVSQTALGSKITTLTETTTTEDFTEQTDKTTIKITKIFTNDTAENIIVNEIGLYGGYDYHYSALENASVFIRDVLDSEMTLTPSNGISVEYEIYFGLPLTKNFGLYAASHMWLGRTDFVRADGNTVELDFPQWNSADHEEIIGLEGETHTGLQIGTGNTTPTINDYNLVNKLTTDWFIDDDKELYNYDSTTNEAYLIYKKIFINNTTSSETVNEVGWYLRETTGNLSILLARYLTGGIVIEPGDALQVVMKISTTM